MAQDVVTEIQKQRGLGIEGAVVKNWKGEVIESVVLQLELLEVGETVEGSGIDVADLVVGQDQGHEIGEVPEGPSLDIFDEISREDDGLKLVHAAELTRSHYAEFVKRQPDVAEIFVNIFVEQVCRDPLKFVRLEIEILELPEIIQRGLADFLNLIIIQRQPK